MGRDGLARPNGRSVRRLAHRLVGATTVLGLLVAGLVVSGSATPAGSAGGSLTGPIGGGFWGSFGAKVGASGSAVAYTTVMRNFNPAWPMDRRVVYLRDRTVSGAAANIPVVRPLAGALPNGNSLALGVSPDPTTSHVLYRSAASNLVAGDTLGHEDIFLFNRATTTTERVSVGNGDVQGNGPATSAAMSGNTANGNPRYVVFTSSASNLGAADGNGKADVFLRDRVAGTTVLVSTGIGGAAANDDSFAAVVSDDGRYVAYSSAASNLVAGDTNGSFDVFVSDRQTATTERVSVGFAGEGIGASTSPQISADGRFVAFDSSADELVPDDDNISYDVFVRDRANGSLERVSVGPNGEQGDSDSESPSMSRDGRYIAFDSEAEEFNANDGNISFDVYVRDRLARTSERASEKGNGFEAFAESVGASISPDGRYVGFDTDSGEFFENTDLNDDYDIYLKDMAAPFFNNPTVGSRFSAMSPKRLLDTSAGPVPGGSVVGAKLAAGTTLDLQVAGGTTTVPTSAQAVVLNVATTAETANGAEVTLYPAGVTPRPKTVALHPLPGFAVSNQVTVKVGTSGVVRLYNNKGTVHVTADVVGYYAPDLGDAFSAAPTQSLVDTRGPVVPAGWPAGQPILAGGAFGRLDVQVAGMSGVPANASAVVLNLTAMNATVGGAKVTAYAAGASNPGTANVYTRSGDVVSNTAIVAVGAGGKVSIASDLGAVHVAVAVAGYYAPSGADLYFPLTPARVLDTRSTLATLAIQGRSGPLLAGTSASFSPAGRGGVPLNAHGVALVMSSTDAGGGPGFLLTWPTGNPIRLVSELSFGGGRNTSDTIVSGLGTGGGIDMLNFSGISANLFADASGYYR